MKKLVVTYSDGDGYTYSCDVVLCVNYESKEKFLFDFELAIINASERYNDFQKKYAEWESANPKKNGRVSPKKMDEIWQAWYLTQPQDPDKDIFRIAGHLFELRTFIYEDSEKTKRYIMPEVEELEQWFALHVPKSES